MDITKMEIKELKALAYDVATSIQKLQNDLVRLNNEIVRKSVPQLTGEVKNPDGTSVETIEKTPEKKEK